MKPDPEHTQFPDPFTRVIRCGTGQDAFRIVYNSLHASFVVLPEGCPPDSCDVTDAMALSSLTQDSVNVLTRKGMITDKQKTVSEIIQTIQSLEAQTPEVCKLGFILDSTWVNGDTSYANALEASNDVLSESAAKRSAYYIWLQKSASLNEQIEFFNTFRQTIQSHPEFLQIMAEPHTAPAAREIKKLAIKNTLLKLFIDIKDETDKEETLQAVIDRCEELGKHGLKTVLICNITPETAPFFLNTFLKGIMQSGLYLTVIDRIHFTSKKTGGTSEDALCEYDRIDWEALIEIRKLMFTRKRFQIFQPFGLGIINQTTNSINFGSRHAPRLKHCHIADSTLIFSGNGHIYACPKAITLDSEKGSIGRYGTTVSINPQQQEKWHKRSVADIPACRNCRDSVVCAGGCTHQAVVENGQTLSAACQSVDAYVKNEALLNIPNRKKYAQRMSFIGEGATTK